MLDMHDTHVQALDLRSLNFLKTLLTTASVTRSGEAFGLSQPAASRAVARLRLALGDPLLVRGSNGYVLTARAIALVPLVTSACASVEAVFAPAVFDPAATSRSFRIATTDYGALTVLADLARQMAGCAPSASLEIAPWASDTLDRLEQGSLDAALYPEAPLPQDFHFKPLFGDDYVLLMDASQHDMADLSPKYIEKCRRIVTLYPDGQRLSSDDVLGDHGAAGSCVALRTPYFTSAAWALPGTQLIAAIPRRVAERFADTSRLAIVPLPMPSPTFGYRLIWHERTHRDLGHRWLRSQL